MDRKFRTVFDKGIADSVTGSAYANEYSAHYDDNGTLVLDVVGKKDVYSEIQSYKDSVEIYNILRRFAAGEIDVLNKVQGFYKDVKDMPKTYQDVLNTVIKTQTFFDSLPVEDKQRFNNSFSEFLVAVGDPDFIKGFEPDDVVKPPVDEAKAEPVSDSVEE